ncbi:hypothetical protein [Lederbergia citrea]|uniref:Uncharacterized protein n=1 Tax=Lederbergia citrea TaxID=2833581 RepID=A0A942Z742_9BACI|nr:hypothetical protein [Lederbergia citrea]MBS4179489.1 hypothetical protein [Lederbergia citrea]MBS4224907.1 hypothetical protein [Lederbergia citrea]
MAAKERKWRRVYLFLMIFFYGIYTPVSIFEWLAADGKFPFTAIVVGLALPFMRKNHLNQIQQQKN